MPKLEYFLVAESISIDQNTNRISLFHVLDDVFSSGPLVFSHLAAVSCWDIAPEEIGRDFQATLDIRLPGNARPSELEDFTINFTPEHRRHRINHYVDGLRVLEAGDVVFEILLNGKPMGRHVITIHPPDAHE